MIPEFFKEEMTGSWLPWKKVRHLTAQELETVRGFAPSGFDHLWLQGVKLCALKFPNGRVWTVRKGWVKEDDTRYTPPVRSGHWWKT